MAVLPAVATVFTGQGTQTLVPEWYELSGHNRPHVPPARPYQPVLQIHELIVVLPAGENEFTGHERQFSLIVYELYFPGEHCAHWLLGGTVEKLPGMHDVHVRPSPLSPAAHEVHTSVMLSAVRGGRCGHWVLSGTHEHTQMSHSEIFLQ